MDPCSCGRAPVAGDRFCGGCGVAKSIDGLPAVTVPSGPTVDESLSDGLLIGGSGSQASPETSIQSESQVKSPAQLRWVLFGVAALGVLVFGLAQWPQSEPPPQAAADAETDTAGDDEATDDDNASGDEPEDAPGEEVAVIEEVFEPDPPEDDEDRRAGEGLQTDEPADPPGPAVQALGETTGLGLVVSSGAASIKIFDLDTSELHELSMGGEVMAALDSTLVVRSSSSDQILLVDLKNPDSEGIPLASPADGYMDLASTENDLLWVSRSGPTDSLPTLEAFDLNGNKVDEVSIETLGLAVFFWGGSTSLVQVEGAGIYRRNGEDFRWVADGALLAYDDPLALIRRCDAQMRCEAAWYESPNFTDPLEMPAPETGSLERFSVAGDGRWLVRTNWNNGASEIIEIDTGKVVRATAGDAYFGLARAAPISQDGRWLVEQRASKVTAVDLLNGVEFELDVPASAGFGPPPIFVEMDNTAFG